MNKKTMMIRTTTQLLQALMGLLGLLMLWAVMKEFILQNLNQHPVITTGVLTLFAVSVLLGSKKRRDTLLHVVNQATNWEQLLMNDPEEEHIMQQREQKLGEAGSMDLWR